MRKQLLVFVGLVCLLGEVTGTGIWSRLNSSPRPRVDLDGLNKWLVLNLAHTNEVETNVAFLKDNLNSIKDLKVKEAGNMMLEIVGASKCDEHLLASIGQMSAGKGDATRTSRAIRWAAEVKLNTICGKWIDGTVWRLYEAKLAGLLSKFVEIVSLPDSKNVNVQRNVARAGLPEHILKTEPASEYFFYTANVNDHSLDPAANMWAQYLRFLSLSSAEKFKLLSQNRAQFANALNKHLVGPCLSLTAVLGDIFEGLYGLAEVQCSSEQDYELFLAPRSHAVNRLLYGYKVCKSLQESLGPELIDAIFKESSS